MPLERLFFNKNSQEKNSLNFKHRSFTYPKFMIKFEKEGFYFSPPYRKMSYRKLYRFFVFNFFHRIPADWAAEEAEEAPASVDSI